MEAAPFVVEVPNECFFRDDHCRTAARASFQRLRVTWIANRLNEGMSPLHQRMCERVRSASCALVVATVGLVICIAGLIWATLAA
jgi:hypothetical protein